MSSWLRSASRVADGIDRFSEWTGRTLYWLTLVMVLVGSYNAVVRYLGRYTGTSLSSNAYIELQWYFFSVVFLLCAAYTLRRDAHVRVDVFYGRLSNRGRAVIDLAGTLLFLLPFCVVMIWLSWPSVANSWAIREVSPDPGGLARYPIKTILPIAFALLILQGLAETVRHLRVLLGAPDDAADNAADDAANDAATDPGTPGEPPEGGR